MKNTILKRSLPPIGMAVLLWSGSMLTAGCAYYTDYSAFISEPRPVVSLQQYRVLPPDSILINSKRVRELDGHRERIGPDGRIMLPLVGSIFVAGRTIKDIAAEVELLAKDFYEDADITMRVSSFNSKKIYVFGEVGRSGPYPYFGANTVLGTLAIAGPTRLADPSRIQILRPNKDKKLIRRMTINLDKMIKKGHMELNAVLEEGDIIYVPPSPLAAIGLTLQQLLLPISPAASVVAGPPSIDDETHSRTYGGNEN